MSWYLKIYFKFAKLVDRSVIMTFTSGKIFVVIMTPFTSWEYIYNYNNDLYLREGIYSYNNDHHLWEDIYSCNNDFYLREDIYYHNNSFRVGDTIICTGFSHMTRQLQSLAQGRLVLVLEGGYDLKSMSDSAEACLQTLLGHEVGISSCRFL